MPTLTRTIISIEEDEKKWLDAEAKRVGVPRTEIVRMSIRYMRTNREKAFEDLLQQTGGTWKQGDGMEYQNRLRSEWE